MNRLLITVTTFILLAGNCHQLYGQKLYDLEAAIVTALDNNYSILIARNRQDIATGNFTRGNAGLLPTVDLSGRYGGTLNSTLQRFDDGGESSSSGVHNRSATAGVNLGWSIFRGFHARTTYQKLEELSNLGELATQQAVENLIARIVSEYNFYLQQRRLYSNLNFALDISRERLRIDEEKYLLGAGSKLQLLQSRVYFNSDSSRLARQSEVLRASEIRLNELMAVDDLARRITVADTAIHIDHSLSYEMLLGETIAMNTSLNIARTNKVISGHDYRIIASRSYPYINLTSGYSGSVNSYGSGNINQQLGGGFSYGVTLGMGIFDGYNRQRERRNAEIEIENTRLRYEEIEQQVIADLLTIWSGYSSNLSLIELEKQNLATASENLEIAMERYRLGNLSGLDLREVQKSLLDAEERLLSIEYQTKLAEISLMQISGNILGYL